MDLASTEITTMLPHVIACCLCATLVAASPSLSSAGQPRSEPKILEQNAYFGLNPPDTLQKQVRDADAVILAEIVSSVVKAKPVAPETLRETGHLPFGAAPKVYTEYSLNLLEVLKQPRPDQGILRVGQGSALQLVGEYRWREYLIKANADSPVPEEGRAYVLVLSWSDELGGYLINPNGVYELDNTRVNAKGRIPAAKAQQGRPKEEFLRDIRQAAR